MVSTPLRNPVNLCYGWICLSEQLVRHMIKLLNTYLTETDSRYIAGGVGFAVCSRFSGLKGASSAYYVRSSHTAKVSGAAGQKQTCLALASSFSALVSEKQVRISPVLTGSAAGGEAGRPCKKEAELFTLCCAGYSKQQVIPSSRLSMVALRPWLATTYKTKQVHEGHL